MMAAAGTGAAAEAVAVVAGAALIAGAFLLVAGYRLYRWAHFITAWMTFGFAVEAACTIATGLPYYVPLIIGALAGAPFGVVAYRFSHAGFGLTGLATGVALSALALSTPSTLLLEASERNILLYVLLPSVAVVLALVNAAAARYTHILMSSLLGAILVMLAIDHVARTGFALAVLGVFSALLGGAPVFLEFTAESPEAFIGWPGESATTPPYWRPALMLASVCIVAVGGILLQAFVTARRWSHPSGRRLRLAEESDDEVRELLRHADDYNDDDDDDYDAEELPDPFFDPPGTRLPELTSWGTDTVPTAPAVRVGRVFG